MSAPSQPTPSDLFAARLRAARERAGISQAELARRIAALQGANLESTAITRIEQQTRAVRLEEAVYAAQALDVPLLSLLSEDPTAVLDEQIHQQLGRLAAAEQNFEAARAEKDRLTRMVIELQRSRAALSSAQAPQQDQGLHPEG